MLQIKKSKINIWKLLDLKKKSQDIESNIESDKVNIQKTNYNLLNNSGKMIPSFTDMDFKWIEDH